MTTSQTTPTFKATNQSDHETQVTTQAERQMHNHVSGPPTWQNLPRDITAPTHKKPNATACLKRVCGRAMCNRGYGATAARLTPDQKVGSSNLSGLIYICECFAVALRRICVNAGCDNKRLQCVCVCVCVCAFLLLICKTK